MILLLEDIDIGPSEFDAWRDEITGCACRTCTAVACANTDERHGSPRWRLVAAVVLLEELKAGTHVHRSYEQMASDARATAIVNGTYGRTVFKSGSFMVSGIGAGMTPGGVR